MTYSEPPGLVSGRGLKSRPNSHIFRRSAASGTAARPKTTVRSNRDALDQYLVGWLLPGRVSPDTWSLGSRAGARWRTEQATKQHVVLTVHHGIAVDVGLVVSGRDARPPWPSPRTRFPPSVAATSGFVCGTPPAPPGPRQRARRVPAPPDCAPLSPAACASRLIRCRRRRAPGWPVPPARSQPVPWRRERTPPEPQWHRR